MKQSLCACGCGQSFAPSATYPSGAVRRTPQKFIHGHNATHPDMKARFWSKVDIRSEGECWEWKASLRSTGYGQFEFGGTMLKSHRVAYVLTHGAIPDGLHVCHTCDNRKCCNPSHLWLGTNADNTADKVSKGRAIGPKGKQHGWHTHPERMARGERASKAKLTREKVEQIKKLREDGMGQRAVARMFGVTHSAIAAIEKGRTWQ